MLAAVLLVTVCISIAFAADWMYRTYGPERAAAIDLTNPSVFVEQLGTSVRASEGVVPNGLTQELAYSRMYLMLANKGSIFAQPHVLEKSSFSPIPKNETNDWFYSTSPDGTLLTFFATTPEREGMAGGWGAQARLYTIPTDKLAGSSLPTTFDEAYVVDDTDIPNKLMPNISDQGNVLFTGQNEGGEWSIFVATKESKAEEVTAGFMPQWINDSEFLFLRQDGLYIADTDSFTPRQLVAIVPDASADPKVIDVAHRLDVSSNGKTVAWARADTEMIHIYDITRSPRVTLNERGTLSQNVKDVVVSPTGTYVAAKVVTDAVASIQFFDVPSLSLLSNATIPLAAFEAGIIRLTDWTIRI